MRVAVIGTGFIGGILGRAIARAGHQVTFGSRRPHDDQVSGDTAASVTSIDQALADPEVVILALPGQAVPELVDRHREALAGRLVVDATNQMGRPVANCRAALPETVRYVRAFNTLGGENMEDPDFADGPADMFFTAPAGDRRSAEELIEAVGLRPVYLGEDEEALVDSLFQLWITLAMKQGWGRRLALRVLTS